MKYLYSFALLSVSLVLIGASCSAPNTSSPDTNPTTTPPSNQPQQPTMGIDSPVENAEVNSPIEVSGKVPGAWASEGQLQVELWDENNTVLSSAVVSVPNWMTNDLQDFEASLGYTSATKQNGKIIVIKGNPSGLAENADQLERSIILEVNAPNAGGIFSQWSLRMMNDLGVSAALPQKFERQNGENSSVAFSYLGSTQTTATELFDGISVSFYLREKGENQSLESVVQELYNTDDSSPVKESISEDILEVTIAGEQAYMYTYTSLGEIDKYFFLNKNNQVVEISVLDPDPENHGYTEVSQAIIASIEKI